MNKKALSLAITLAMAFPAASHALGLGDIQSNSHLNQPFKGKIPVLSATPAEAKNIRVKIASREVFNRVGIDRPAFLNSIRFRPTVENGKPIILVSSTQPIHEPFVNFLLEVNWPKGQLLKEYTALLDPPVLMQPGTAVASNTVGVRPEPGSQGRINRPAAQQPRRQQQRRIVRAPAPTARRTPARQAPAIRQVTPNRRIAAAPQRTRTYRVKSGDTLYKVAKKLGYRGVRTEQMMMALYEANPKAFHKKNVNILKKGALMRQVTAQQARGISYRSARSQLASQTASWKKYRAELAGKAGKATSKKQVAKNGQQAGKSASTPATEKTNKTPEHKMIVSGSNGGEVSDINVAGNATVAELKKQLALASESLTARTNENAELKSRVAELESLLRKKNRLITLKSEQLAELQARMGGEITPQKEPEATTVVESEPEEPITTTVSGEGSDIQQQVASQNAIGNGEIIRAAEPEVEEPIAEEPNVEEPVAAVPATEDKGIIGRLLEDPIGALEDPMVRGIGGGSLLALLGGLWFMRRRKGEKVEAVDEEYVDFALDHELSQNNELATDIDEELVDTGISESDFGVEGSMFAEETTQVANSDAAEDVEGESKEENILQEADVYLVYGLHDQAEAELRKALEEDPGNLAYHAKLIENYKAAGDIKGFEKEVKIFKGLEGPNKEKLWQDISAWGKSLIPDSNLFTAKDAAVAAGAGAVAAGVAVTAGEASPEEVTQFSEDLDKVLDDDGLEDLESVLDDDFSIDDTAADGIDLTASAESLDTALDMGDFDLDSFKAEQPEAGENSIERIVDEFDNGLDMSDAVENTGTNDSGLGADLNVDAELDSSLDTKPLDTSLDISDLNSDDSKSEETLEFTTDSMTESVSNLDNGADLIGEKTGEKIGEELDMTHLNLDIDAKEFDKIMPEDHAYKKIADDVLNNNVDENAIVELETAETENLSIEDIVLEDHDAKKDTVDNSEDNLLADFDDNLSFLDLEDSGEVIEETQIGTKLDLAKAYIDMGDIEGARSTLEEVMMEGNDEQKKEAEELLHQTG